MHCTLLGVPVQSGTGRRGCDMGPNGLRAAGLAEAIAALGHTVRDVGDLKPAPQRPVSHPNASIKALPETVAWLDALVEKAYELSAGALPIFMGGDHVMAAGTVAGVAGHAKDKGRPLFVLWLDAHPDFHTLESTESGNLHGTPAAYFTGQEGFSGIYPDLVAPVDPANVCMVGIRSVDPAERTGLRQAGVTVHDMRAIDENGIAVLIKAFLERVEAENGMLHVSFDVDFLDPSIAPGVGTTVPGGATFREAHLVMEMLHDSGLVTSLDLVELNPFLDERGKAAILLTELTASLFGRQVMDRPTRSYG
ncbi:arginase [Martelella endophytica]|uniref:Arginase n=1 Tax=Martelella endophytica TaxID=1486262 RepID=A0A0D5LQQ3_MAREN|nr:arginase [Martelella endophytica]AJY45673.1 arginase [Martelella endophytica]